MSFLHSVTTIGFYTFASRVLGFIRDMFITSFVGAGAVFDAFIVAFKLPNFFRRLFAEGAFNAAFVPIFSQINERDGHEKAFRFATNIFFIMLGFLTLLSLLFVIGMPIAIKIIAPGFDTTLSRYKMAVDFGRIAFPYILFISLSALLSGVLNALHRFTAAAFAPILLNIAMIGMLIVSYFVDTAVGMLLVYGVAIAGILQLGFLIIAASRAGFKLHLRLPHLDEKTKILWRKMVPGVVSAGVIQINMFIGLMVSSLLPAGNISYCSIADRVYQLPLSVIGVAMGTALLPLFSKKVHQNDWDGIRSTCRRSVEFSLFLSVPSAVALMVIGGPILSVLFQRNAFTAQDVAITNKVLFAFATGLPAFVMSKIFSAGFFAASDTKTPMKYAIITVIINSILNVVLVLSIGISGIGWSTSIASWINIFLLGYSLSQLKFIEFRKIITRFLPRLLMSSALMAAVLYYASQRYAIHFEQGEFHRAIALFLLIIVGSLVYLIPSFSLGVTTIKKLRRSHKPKKIRTKA